MSRFKSTAQPLCRCCGKPIPKWTETVFFGRIAESVVGYSKSMTQKPKTREEAQTLVNMKIVSVSRAKSEDYIWRAGLWDGETYADQFFCKGTCAQIYAYTMVSSPNMKLHCTKYLEAKKTREGQ